MFQDLTSSILKAPGESINTSTAILIFFIAYHRLAKGVCHHSIRTHLTTPTETNHFSNSATIHQNNETVFKDKLKEPFHAVKIH